VGAGRAVGELEVAAVLPVAQATVVERVEHQLALEAEQVDRTAKLAGDLHEKESFLEIAVERKKQLEKQVANARDLLKQHGLVCALTGSHGFAKGFAHVEEHAECLKVLRERIDATAAAGFPAVITFSGFQRGISDAVGTKNMVEGLKKIAGYAEEKKVTVCLEMLNSKVSEEMKGHPDYFCNDIDHSVKICRLVGSERVKVLFDIYHVQIMHGDVIRRIQQHKDWIGHYHTAGVPGRNEIDGTQEINYGPIMQAIVNTGYRGYVGQEFIPLRDKVTSISEAVRICDV
jgi:hydroxypyruvate isomerase